MNSFGSLFRVHIFGESHGECVGITVDGCPAGLSLSRKFVMRFRKKKGGKQKVLHQRQRRKIIPFLKKVVCLMEKQPGFPNHRRSKIKIPEAKIIISNCQYSTPGRTDWVASKV